jgi:hypothetical protein
MARVGQYLLALQPRRIWWFVGFVWVGLFPVASYFMAPVFGPKTAGYQLSIAVIGVLLGLLIAAIVSGFVHRLAAVGDDAVQARAVAQARAFDWHFNRQSICQWSACGAEDRDVDHPPFPSASCDSNSMVIIWNSVPTLMSMTLPFFASSKNLRYQRRWSAMLFMPRGGLWKKASRGRRFINCRRGLCGRPIAGAALVAALFSSIGKGVKKASIEEEKQIAESFFSSPDRLHFDQLRKPSLIPR